uniref:CCHC-type domain-containing protein n=1 Tax=Erpetoichthys calabaricus TaxID=27687 RepID=A0A8C4RK21_ERPCA
HRVTGVCWSQSQPTQGTRQGTKYLPGRGDTFGSSLSGVGSAPRPWIQSWVGWLVHHPVFLFPLVRERRWIGIWKRRRKTKEKRGSFELKEEQMERKEFSIEVLQKTLKFIPGEIDFLFAFPGKTTFEVVFKTRYLYDKCVRTVEREKEVNLILDKFLIVPLSDRLDKKVNVIMYTEKVKIQDISTWLLQYCDVKTSMQMTDDDGIKNGLYKFDIILKKERDTDRVIHLPPVIQIGAVRGHVFYPGQPQVCRRCGKEGHKVLECIVVKCRNCKEEGHSTRECRKQIICNLCGQEAHAFKDCPVSYANIVKVNKTDKNGVGHKESGGS